MNNVKLLTVIAFIFFMSRGIIGPVSSLYMESLGANYVAIGLLGTTFSLTAVFSSYLWGQTSDRIGRRKIFLILSLAIMSVNYWLTALIPSYEYMFPLSLLGSASQAAYTTASLALMGDLLERRHESRGRRIGTYRGLGSLGFGLTAFISGSVADWSSLRTTFNVGAIFMAAAFLLALRIKETSPSDRLISNIGQKTDEQLTQEVETVSVTYSKRHQELPLAPLLISTFLWFLVTGAVYAVWANYMVGELGYGQAEMSRLWGIASLSELPFMILAGWLSDRLGRLAILSVGFVAWTFVFLGYVLVPVTPWIILVQLIRGFAYSAFTATSMTYATEARSKPQRGRVSGLYNSSGSIGSILGSTMGGALAQFTNFRTMIATNAAIIFIGAVHVAIVEIRRSRD
jgi:MFS family permease